MISAKVIAHSSNEFENEIATMLVTFPRIILAEFNTHRMFSRNSASSRAIPYKKMLKSVMDNPFIPIAFQKDHSGMQGREYLDIHKLYTFDEIKVVLRANLEAAFKNSEDHSWEESDDYLDIKNILDSHLFPLLNDGSAIDLRGWWLKVRDVVIAASMILASMGVTKQLCNRLLEPFMWHTCIVTATEWENFFALRCPQYEEPLSKKIYRSRKDLVKDTFLPNSGINKPEQLEGGTYWLSINKGQAEIHMMALAEAMWDALNESTPKQLKAGEWHIPNEETINELFGITQKEVDENNIPYSVKISTMMSARTSYTVVGGEMSSWNIDKHVEKCNELINSKPLHASPLEHCARAMDNTEYTENLQHSFKFLHDGTDLSKPDKNYELTPSYGISGNFRGFIQYRKMIPNENITG